MLNTFFLIRMGLSVLFLLEDYLIPKFPFVISLSIHGTVMLAIVGLFYLQHRARHHVACGIFLLMIYTEVFAFSYLLQPGMGAEYFYLSFPLVALVFFDNQWVNIAYFLLAIACFFLPKVLMDLPGKDDVLPFSTLGLFITIYIIVNYFKRLNLKNENQLAEQRNQAVEDHALIRKQKSQLEELHSYQRRFFENLAHEVRTPITILKGTFYQVFKSGPSPSHKENIDGQIHRIERIVNDVIDLSKMTSNHLELNLKAINISELVHKVHQMFAASYHQKGVDLNLHDYTDRKQQVQADTVYLERSINNLLNNALKYTDKGGQVTLELRYGPLKNTIYLSVKDTGIGICESDLEFIFDQFYQAKNSVNEAGGSGIGLAYAREIIDMHGGQIKVFSIPNKGSKFIILLPLTSPAASAYQSSSVPIQTVEQELTDSLTAKPKMLLVEDQPELRQMISSIFPDFACMHASNGVEGLDLIKSNTFEIILVDYMMPRMNGREFITQLKAAGNCTPIIVITALADAKLAMLRLGVDDFLAKPFDPEELIARVNNSLINAQSRQEYIKISSEPLENPDKALIEKLQSHIASHCSEFNLSVEMLCNEFGLSASSLYRKIKSATGLSTREFLTEVKLQKARNIKMTNPDITARELSLHCGWKNQTHFSQLYQRRFGTSIS